MSTGTRRSVGLGTAGRAPPAGRFIAGVSVFVVASMVGPGGVAAAEVEAAPVPAFIVSAGYLARGIFESSPSGVSAPLAQGAAVGAALAIPLGPVGVFSSLSVEYHSVTVPFDGCVSGPACTAPMGRSTFDGVAAYGLFGLNARPVRFLEIGAGLGPAVARNRVDVSGGAGSAVWRAVARGLVSVAAVGLPAGMEVTAALTLDRTIGAPYAWQVPVAIDRPLRDPTPTSLQAGVLVMIGWRR